MLAVSSRRGSVVAELLILALTGLVGLGGAALLQSRTVRQAALERLARTVEQRLGVAFTAEDFRWEARSDRLVLIEPRIGVPHERPVLTARSLTLEARALEVLFGEALELRSATLEAPVLDLTAPLPELVSRPAAPGDSGRSIAIRRFEVHGGKVVGGAMGGEAGLTSWEVRELSVNGSLVSDRLRVELEGAEALARWGAGREGREMAARVAGVVEGPTAGPWSFERVTVRGAHLEAEGSLDVAAGSGRLSWRLTDFPGGLVADFAPEAAESLRGLALASQGDLTLGPADLSRANGRLSVTASRAGAVVARWEARPDAGALPGAPQLLPFALDLFPAEAGRRRVAATLSLPARGAAESDEWLRRVGEEGTWTDGKLEWDEPDLAARLRAVAELAPQLALPAGATAPAGALRLEGSFSGSLLDPRVEVSGTAAAQGLTVRLAGKGRPVAGLGRIDVVANRIDLPLPGLADVAGTASGSLWLERREGGAVRGAARLAAPRLELAGGPEGPRVLEGIEVAAELASGRLSITRLAGSSGPLRVEGTGALALADPSAPLPLTSGRLDVTLAHEASPWGPIPMAVSLERGVLRLDAPQIGGPQAGWLRATVPLASLESIVGRETLVRVAGPSAAGLGPAGAGQVTAEWSLPETDWTGLTHALGAPSSVERLVGSLAGEVALDLSRPLAGRADLTLLGVRARAEQRDLEVEGPIGIHLSDGVLVLDLLQLASKPDAAAPETLTLRGSARLDSGWRFGQPAAGLVQSLDMDGTADLPAAVVVPFLPEGSGIDAAGRLSVYLAATGPPQALEAEVWLEGPEAAWRLTATDSDLSGELRAPVLSASLSGSRLTVDQLAVEANGLPVEVRGWFEAGEGRLRGELERFEVAGCGGGLEGASEGSVITARWEVAPCDWTPILAVLGTDYEAAVGGGLAGRIHLDTARPAAGEGEIEITELALDLAEESVRSASPLRLRWANGAVELEPLELQVAGQALRADGSATLDRDWTAQRPFDELVRHLRIDAEGRVLADLVQPMLAGGRASGAVDLALHLEGAPDALTGRVTVEGPDASLALFSPYFTRLVAPSIEAELEGGVLRIERGQFTLNEGRVDVSGEADLGGAVDLSIAFDHVRYRLDYGLLAFVAGRLRWSGDLTGESMIAGDVTLDRGLLTRPIELDREFLVTLLSPVDLSGSSGGWLEHVGLDLALATGEGVRVRNNLADLLVRWEPLEIGGTLAFPRIKGTVEVDPGGTVRAFNQTIRLERAALTYSGEPGAEPVLDLVTTDSTSDPSIESIARQAAGTVESSFDYESLGEDVATALSEPVIGRLGAALGGTEIKVQGVVPVAVFGEADPSARLNVRRDFSSRVAVVASVDLRNAENQTYILDLHSLPGLSSLGAQAFTLDDGSEGGSLQQSLELGGGGRGDERGLRIHQLTADRPAGISRRAMKRALGVEKGDSLPLGGAFAVEVEVFEYLRRRGFVDPRVAATATPTSEGDEVDLAVEIESGPRVAFRFAGDRPPGRLRESITTLYRPEPFEAPTFREMEAQAVRVFRSGGHLDPQISVEARPPGAADAPFDRVVVITAEAGPEVEVSAPRFEGLPAQESEWVARRFWGPVQRAELALGLPAADERARQAMRDLGYVEPQVMGRGLVDGALDVQVSAAGRQRVERIEVIGLPAEIDRVPSITVGEPLRYDRVGAEVLAFERALRAEGYADAVVRSRIERENETALPVTVRFDVDAGSTIEIADVRLEGVVATREKWAEAVADLPEGEPLVQDEVQAVRRRLYATGLFSRVSYRIDRLDGNLADVVLELEERPRFRVAYGARWDSGEGASALFEAEDRNFLGRNLDIAFRGLWADQDYSVRGLFGMPRLFGTLASLDLFTLASRQIDDGLIRDRREATLQFSLPLSSRFTGRTYVRWRDDEIREEEPDPFFPIMERIRSPLLGLQLLYDDRLDRTAPEDGFFGSVDLSGADDRIGGDFRYLRLFAQLHWYRPTGRLGSWPITWAQSYRFGVAKPFGDQQLIFQNRFFAGGEYSVRGYDRDSLGPQEQLGSIARPAGGEALMVLNQELRVRVNDTFTGLLFADAGNVWASRADFASDLVAALGVGLRATTPLGLLRLDVAHPLDAGPEDSEWTVHFGFGNVF
jgi:outer membrane protein assembly factor BamA